MTLLLSENDSTIITSVTNDGRIWGPFETHYAASEWKDFFNRRAHCLVTAQEIFEGSVCGDEYHYINADAFEYGLHPFSELYEIMIEDDNGKVVFDSNKGIWALPPETAIYVASPFKSEPTRRLPVPVKAPQLTDIDGRFHKSIPSVLRGEILVLGPGLGDSLWTVAWRADKRVTKDLRVISVHSNEHYATIEAKRKAISFTPPHRVKRRRERDSQKERVYQWEHSFNYEREKFSDIQDCRNFLHDVCDRLGIKAPEISLGKSNLKSCSYYSPLKGIVMSSEMLNSETVLHELAHHLCKNERTKASHGPHFTAILAGMLTIFSGADLDEAIQKAGDAGVEINEEKASEFIAAQQNNALKL